MLDRFSSLTGKATAWLTLAMVLVTFVVVILRYVFDIGLIWLQESVVWMHAFVFMVGAAYTLKHEGHVRVDIFYRAMSPGWRAWVDVIGVAIFLFPLCAFLGYKAIDYVALSWTLHESSREAGGLPYPLLPLLKSTLLIMPLMLGLQGASMFANGVRTIKGN